MKTEIIALGNVSDPDPNLNKIFQRILIQVGTKVHKKERKKTKKLCLKSSLEGWRICMEPQRRFEVKEEIKGVFENTKKFHCKFSIFRSSKIRWIPIQKKLGSGSSKLHGSGLGFSESGFETIMLKTLLV